MKIFHKPSRRVVIVSSLLASLPVLVWSSASSAASANTVPIDGGMHVPHDIDKGVSANFKPGSGPGYNLLANVPASAKPWKIRLTSAADRAGLRTTANAAADDFNAVKLGITLTVLPGTVPENYEPKGEEILINSADNHFGDACGDGKTPWTGCGGPTHFVANDLGTFIDGGKVTVHPKATGANYLREVAGHEIGHVLGLDHYDAVYKGRYQLMKSRTTGSTGFKAGDVNGLRNQFDIHTNLDSSLPGFITAAGEQMDFDGDGRSDVFVVQNGQWRFSPGGASAWKNLSRSVVRIENLRFGDFNGDGKTDVFTVRPGDGRWMYRSGGFGDWIPMASGASLDNLRLGDFNGDGKTDVFTVFKNGRWNYSPGGTNRWVPMASGASLTNIRFGDFNGDGKTDVFTVFKNGRWNYSPGGTNRWVPMASGASLTNIRLGDFDGDRKTDVFTVHKNGRWAYSSGGTRAWKYVASGASLTSMRFGDFDGDRKTDVFVVHKDGRWAYSPGGAAAWKYIASGASLNALRVQ